MKITVSTEKVEEIHADCEFVLVVGKQKAHKWVKDSVDLETLNFKGELEESAFLPHQHRVYVGVDSLDRDEIRVALSTAIKAIAKTNYKTIKIGSYVKTCPAIYTKAIAEGALLGSYTFERYKSKKEEKIERELIISLEEYHDKELKIESAQKAIAEATIIANATNFAKDIVNAVPDDMTPEQLAHEAQKIADSLDNVECFIGDETFLEEQNMGAFAAVARASVHKPRFIHLTYNLQKN